MGCGDSTSASCLKPGERKSVVLPQSVFEGIAGRRLFYPCAGNDWAEPISLFADWIDSFQFDDICYDFTHPVDLPIDRTRYLLQAQTLAGPSSCRPQFREDEAGRSYRFITPASLTETFWDTRLRRTLQVVRRRGFGQYGLNRLPDGELSVFIHRGDSLGEGGSNTWYLANRPARHPPLANLLEALKRKLSSPAIVVTDGSNTRIDRLRSTYGRRRRDSPSKPHQIGDVFTYAGLSWLCVGQIGHSARGPTFVWKVMMTSI